MIRPDAAAIVGHREASALRRSAYARAHTAQRRSVYARAHTAPRRSAYARAHTAQSARFVAPQGDEARGLRAQCQPGRTRPDS
jgi:hypothetical protein